MIPQVQVQTPTYQDFLREVFYESPPNSFVRFVTGIPGVQFPKDWYWHHVEDVLKPDFAITEEDEDLFNMCGMFFTPHTYVSPRNGSKENASEMGTAIWIECDDEFFNPENIEEAPPSAIIETSHRRYHIYWFLKEPIPLPAIEAINQSLTYKYLKHDRGGWDISQLLRIPQFVNTKRRDPHVVRIISLMPERRYDPKVFAGLPDMTSSPNLNELEAPSDESLATIESLMVKYNSMFDQRLKEILSQRAPDRSRALWYLYNECIRLNIPQEDTFVLAYHSPNNKFADSKYNGENELWRDVTSAYRMHSEQSSVHILQEIENIRLIPRRSIRDDERKLRIAKAIHGHMASRGRFYYSRHTRETLYEYRRELITVNERNTEFKRFLDVQYHLNPSTYDFRFVAWHLKDWGAENGLEVTLYDLSHYNADENLLYITDHDGGLWRLDGEQIQRLENGIDGGVVFNSDPKADPYDLEEIEFLTPHATDWSPIRDHILSKPNYVISPTAGTRTFDREDFEFLVRAWLYSMFFLEESKPLLVLAGDRGSGKSTLFKAMEWFLTGSRANVTELPSEAKEFREVIRGKHHVFFDGVDEVDRWLQKALSTVATGSEDRRRILYTDNEFAVYGLNCAMGLSTMDSSFLRNDVVDRSIILATSRFREFDSIDEAHGAVVRHRRAMWKELLTDLNLLVEGFKTWVPEASTLRMSNFAQVLLLLCQIKKKDPTRFLEYLQGTQDAVVLDQDVLWETLNEWLQKEDNLGKGVTAQQLHTDLREIAINKEQHYATQIKSSKQLVRKLMDLVPNLNSYSLSYLTRTDNRREYTFTKVAEENV